MMYVLQGQTFLSEFQQDKLLRQVKATIPTLQTIHAHAVYFVASQPDLSNEQKQRLQDLLSLESWQVFALPAQAFVVVPRLGTISPWSDKATDIAHHCNLPIQRIEKGICYQMLGLSASNLPQAAALLHDRMTESLLFSADQLTHIFQQGSAKPLQFIPLLKQGKSALELANQQLGLALNELEINYLWENYQKLQRDPTDVELMMFAQVNSEHCRHKIFNTAWQIDGKTQSASLFQMIKNTFTQHSEGVLSAYQDNAAIIEGKIAARFLRDPDTHHYFYQNEAIHSVIKVETHNHPTAISPFPGAATGSGGEIRDEGATGCGANPKAGLVGFSVSHLHIPDFAQPWENRTCFPTHLATPLEIMLQAPIGAASFNNEFGRPAICGYFRTFEMQVPGLYDKELRAYHKPIMLAGGLGNIRPQHLHKQKFVGQVKLIVLGGPAMRIGLGGGAASSLQAGSSDAELDFASVQRSNPEMQRRCQEVIDGCVALGEKNPILSIHDVGAGGLSNALPELVHASEQGATIDLRAIPIAEPDLSPLEIWCNEAQERYVLAIAEKDIALFTTIANRERCPFAVIGVSEIQTELQVIDSNTQQKAVDLPMSVLLGKPPLLPRHVAHQEKLQADFWTETINLTDAIKRVLQFPAVASKNFLITIGDRSVGGLVARDQMVGPWQVPVADVGVTASSFQHYHGEAMAIGERTPIALLHYAASARMAIGEAITNIAAAPIDNISDIKLSANWMAACHYPGEDAGLYDAVQAVGMELCPALGICIPVGKDSLSMATLWHENNENYVAAAPLSLIVSAFALVNDIRKTLTPQLITDQGETELILIDLGEGANFLGGSVLAQVYNQLGQLPPDIDDPLLLKHFFAAIQQLNQANLILAYHDRSDGGLLATICEMLFAGHVGVDLQLEKLGTNALAALFNEELGAVIQIKTAQRAEVNKILEKFQLQHCSHVVGHLNHQDKLQIFQAKKIAFSASRMQLQQWWSETSYRMQMLRDNPHCAAEEFSLLAKKQAGLQVKLTFDPNDNNIVAPFIQKGIKPKIAIMREQGVNGHVEMAAAFDRAGFECIDVHMSDIISGKISLAIFKGLAACGGFSYGDVLGAGTGWAHSILFNAKARDQFAAFFARSDTFALGICNGCQMLSQLTELIPGSEDWPRFVRNKSQQFEARFTMVEIPQSPSLFFKGMAGSYLPIVVSHGEGRVQFKNNTQQQNLIKNHLIALRYVDAQMKPTEIYPLNPNGSVQGITGVTTKDGRVTLLMPHPERIFRTVQWSWHPNNWSEDSPWMRLFYNARAWVK